MTAIEDRVRAALHDDARPVPVETFLADVRRGARRRRVRRTATATAAAAAVTAAVVGLTAWWSSPNQDRPQPAEYVRWDSPQLKVPEPMADGRLYGLAGTPTCGAGCPTVLWVEDDDGRAEAIHEFPGQQQVYWAYFAPDPRHGVAFGLGEDTSSTRMLVFRTSDGGRAWEEVGEELADYRFVPDVAFLDGDLYVLATPLGQGSPSEPSVPHLWRTPVGGDTWQEVSLTAEEDVWFDMTAGVLALSRADGDDERLAVMTRTSILVSDDGDEWSAAVDLPCGRQPDTTGPTFAGQTPTTLLVWCPAPGYREVQLWRSVDLAPFETLGPPLRRGHMYPTTYPRLVGPFPVETGDGGYAVVRVDESFLRLEPDGRTTRVKGRPELLRIANSDPSGSSSGPDRSYVLTPDGPTVTTEDEGLTWTLVEP